MTRNDVLKVMTKTNPAYKNPGEWQRTKIKALIKAVRANNAKFIWAIGGWSDLTKTLHAGQITNFVKKCVALLKMDGDGIDFDFEHLSEDSSIVMQQRKTLAKTMFKLRRELDRAGMKDKQIGYTTRFNAFWNGESKMRRPRSYRSFQTDGEGITIEKVLNSMGSSLNRVVDWVNVMLYDIPPASLAAPNGLTMDNYKKVLSAFSKRIRKDKIVMGFEPGGQAAGGRWEGMRLDRQVTEFIHDNNYGGVMFWAINQPRHNSQEITGNNVQQLARHARSIFSNQILTRTPNNYVPPISVLAPKRTARPASTASAKTSGRPVTTRAFGSGRLVCRRTDTYAAWPKMTKWCNINCNFVEPYCPSTHCICNSNNNAKQKIPRHSFKKSTQKQKSSRRFPKEIGQKRKFNSRSGKIMDMCM